MFENPRISRQARNFTTNVPKILDLESSSEQIFSENCHWVPLILLTYKVLDRLLLYIMVTALNQAQNKKQSKEINTEIGYTLSCLFRFVFSDTGKWPSGAISRKEKTVLIDVSKSRGI